MKPLRKALFVLLALAMATPAFAASAVYDIFRKDVYNDTINMSTATLKVMLVTSAYTPNVATHVSRADVTNEVSGTGYTAGGVTLSGITFTLDTTAHTCKVTCTNPSWATSTITARGAVVYVSNGGVASGDPVVSYIDFGSDVTSTAGTFTITTFSTSGFITD